MHNRIRRYLSGTFDTLKLRVLTAYIWKKIRRKKNGFQSVYYITTFHPGVVGSKLNPSSCSGRFRSKPSSNRVRTRFRSKCTKLKKLFLRLRLKFELHFLLLTFKTYNNASSSRTAHAFTFHLDRRID